MSFLTELFTLSLIVGCIVGSFVMMFSPKRAGVIFKRLGLAYVFWQVLLLALCLLQQRLAQFSFSFPFSGTLILLLGAIVVSGAAFVIYKIKWAPPKKQLEQRGIERTPQVPPYLR